MIKHNKPLLTLVLISAIILLASIWWTIGKTIVTIQLNEREDHTTCEPIRETETAKAEDIAESQTQSAEISEEAVEAETIPAEAETPQNDASTSVTESRIRTNVPLDAQTQQYINDKCREYGVPEKLIYALMDVESGFDNYATSPTDDYGICQINSINLPDLYKRGVGNIYDVKQGALAGILMLSDALAAGDGNVRLALMVYNYGLYGAQNKWAQGIYTSEYAELIIATMGKYE